MKPHIILLMFLALSLAGCAGDDADAGDSMPGPDDPDDGAMDGEDDADDGTDGGEDGNGTDDGSDDNTTTEKRDPVTWDVSVQDNSFSPATLTIQAGDSVRFVYEGSNPHTATADNGEFDSGDCPGTTCFSSPIGMTEYTWDSTTDDVGDVPYSCEVHASMTGTITVMETFAGTP